MLANHLLENYISLSFAYSILDNKLKQEKYLESLQQELQKQIMADGAHCERTPAYHTQVLHRLFKLVYLFKHRNIQSLTQVDLKKACSRMLGWYKVMSLDGTIIPRFNDSAESTTITYPELLEMATHCDISPDQITFGESGFRILSNGDLTIIVNCGNINPSYQVGHAHADILHVVLYSQGMAILVDTGISTYECIPDRLLEKSTRMHNTVSFAEENQSQIWSSFRIAKRAHVSILEETDQKLIAEVAWHNGIIHKRIFSLSKNKLVIEDFISNVPNMEKMPVANFHFDSLLNNSIHVSAEGVSINAVSMEIFFRNHKRLVEEEYMLAEDFNRCNQAVKISAYFTEHLITEFFWKS